MLQSYLTIIVNWPAGEADSPCGTQSLIFEYAGKQIGFSIDLNGERYGLYG